MFLADLLQRTIFANKLVDDDRIDGPVFRFRAPVPPGGGGGGGAVCSFLAPEFAFYYQLVTVRGGRFRPVSATHEICAAVPFFESPWDLLAFARTGGHPAGLLQCDARVSRVQNINRAAEDEGGRRRLRNNARATFICVWGLPSPRGDGTVVHVGALGHPERWPEDGIPSDAHRKLLANSRR